MQKPLAITMGDPAGIGPEIVLQCFLKSLDDEYSSTVMQGAFVVGDAGHLRRAQQALGERSAQLKLIPIQDLSILVDVQRSTALEPGARVVPYFELDLARCTALAHNFQALKPAMQGVLKTEPVYQFTGNQRLDHPSKLAKLGEISALAGRIAAFNIFWAAQAALKGEISALVTAPIHKQSLHLAGLRFPGHTEMLQYATAVHQGVWGEPVQDGATQAIDQWDALVREQLPVRMMLMNTHLRVVLVSIHLSLARAVAELSCAQIVQTIRVSHAFLSAALGRAPKIAVAGLNPHAGEGGLMGREELEIIEPALALARAQIAGLDVHGPLSPDTVFMKAREGAFDVVVAMYHDQGLIPIKYLGLDKGVNVTLGLPLIRTSPDHGTAFDVVGHARADPSSLWAAIEAAQLFCSAKA